MSENNLDGAVSIAIKQVPAVKYALGVAGVVAVFATIISWGLNPIIVIVGFPVMIFLMSTLVLFVRFSESIGDHVGLPLTVLVWAIIVYIIAAPALCIVIVFTQKPEHLYELLTSERIEVTASANISHNVPLSENKQDIVKTETIDVVVPWNSPEQKGKLAVPIESGYEYVSHKVIEISRNGNAKYSDIGVVGSDVVVDYSVASQGHLFDQKRSWLRLELQVTLRPKN